MAQKGEAYYYVTNEKPRRWISLGSDYGNALTKWAELEGQPVPETARTFLQVSTWYELKVVPKKALRTQRDNRAELKNLRAVFGDSVIETITPVDVRRYLDGRQNKRTGEPVTVRANREIALLSDIVNWARENGITDMANPCTGVERHEELGRERYATDEEFDAIYAKGDELLQDAMDLLLFTSQRPGDVIRMKRDRIIDGDFWVRQGKTRNKLRISIEGDFKAALERMLGRPRKATGLHLVQDRNGQPLTYWQLEDRWSAARAAAAADMPSVADLQMRDIRGKTATDLEDLAHAQKLLGHASRAMTEKYVKQRAGDRVAPHHRRKKA